MPALPAGSEAKLEITQGSSVIKVWQSSDITWSPRGLLMIPDGANMYRTWPAGSQPGTLFVEGFDASSENRDIELTLSCVKDGATLHEDKLKITAMDVLFGQHSNAKYGFDDYTWPLELQFSSVKAGDMDHVLLAINGTSLADNVYFNSQNTDIISVTPTQASDPVAVLTLTAAEQYDAGYGPCCLVWPTLGSEDPSGVHAAHELGVFAWQEDHWRIAIRVVHEEDDDVQEIEPGQYGASESSICVSCGTNGKRDTIADGDDIYVDENIAVGPNLRCDTTADDEPDSSTAPWFTATELENYLSWVYAPAIITFEVDILDDMTVNFDTNVNGYFDWTDPDCEAQHFIQLCEPNSDPDYDKVVFFVDRPHNTEENGGAGGVAYYQGARWAFVFPDVRIDSHRATAHELGHLIGSLLDLRSNPRPDSGEVWSSDEDNLMYGGYGDALRYVQWAQLQHVVNPDE